MERLLTMGLRGQFLALAVLIVVSIAAAWQLPHLYIDRGDSRLIDQTEPTWVDYLRAQSRFGREQNILIYARADDLWSEERLKELQAVTIALEKHPEITVVNDLLTATNIRDKGDFVEAGPLMTVVPRTESRLAELRNDALYSPLIRGNYISVDGLATAITLGYDHRPDDPHHELHIFQLVEEHIAPLRQTFDEVFQIGQPRLNAEIDSGLFEDLKRLTPIAMALMVTVIAIFLGSPRMIPIPLITAGVSLLWTLGFMAVAGIPLSLLTAIIPALIVVVGSVEDVHLIASYLNGLAGNDRDSRQQAIAYMAKHVGLPVLITGLTTALGFFANVISDIPLIIEFAIASAFAMIANLLVTILAIPLLLRYFGPLRSSARIATGVSQGLIARIARRIEKPTPRQAAVITATALVTAIYFGLAARDVTVNNDPLSYFGDNHAFARDAARVSTELSGSRTFSVTLNVAEANYFRSPIGLQKIAEVERALEHQGKFDQVISLATIMSLMHQEYHAGDKDFYRIPTDPDDIELYLSSLTRADLESLVTEDYRSARIAVRHNLANSMALNDQVDELHKLLPAVLGEGVAFAITGKNLMVNRAAEALIQGQISSLLLMLGMIFVLFSVMYTSWLAGILALVPNIIPIVLNYGFMGLLGIPLNPGTAMVAAIAIGVAVDDTIHLMTRFGAESKRHVDEHNAVRATVRGEVLPIVSTSIALALGFAVFAGSSFSILAQFGLLAAATMVYAACADLVLMPILLSHLRLATVWDIIALKLDRRVVLDTPLFKDLSEVAIKKVILLSDIETFVAGETVIRQGDVSTGMYVILRGSAEISIQRDDVTISIDQLGPGEVFGEIGYSGQGVRRIATVTASDSLTVARLDANSTHKGLRFYPNIAARLNQNISVILGQRLSESHLRLLASQGRHDDSYELSSD